MQQCPTPTVFPAGEGGNGTRGAGVHHVREIFIVQGTTTSTYMRGEDDW